MPKVKTSGASKSGEQVLGSSRNVSNRVRRTCKAQGCGMSPLRGSELCLNHDARMTSKVEAYRNAALSTGKQRKAEKAAFRAKLFSELMNLPTDKDGIFRLMGMVQAGKLERWVSVDETRSIERTLRTVTQSLKAAEFYAFRREGGERAKLGPPKPMSLAEQQRQSHVLQELDEAARLYIETERLTEGAEEPVRNRD